MDKQQKLKKILEALFFVATEPLTLDQLLDFCSEENDNWSKEQILEAINELIYEYADKGFVLLPIAGGWQFFSSETYAPFVEKYCLPKMQHLSKAAMETLAIIAYRQPVTRQEIENIRQVNVDAMVNKLLDKNLIREVGRKETLGKPMLYGTTAQFLSFLGLNSLQDLPPLEDFLQKEEG
jgi:segregation and condensation protein B